MFGGGLEARQGGFFSCWGFDATWLSLFISLLLRYWRNILNWWDWSMGQCPGKKRWGSEEGRKRNELEDTATSICVYCFWEWLWSGNSRVGIFFFFSSHEVPLAQVVCACVIALVATHSLCWYQQKRGFPMGGRRVKEAKGYDQNDGKGKKVRGRGGNENASCCCRHSHVVLDTFRKRGHGQGP